MTDLEERRARLVGQQKEAEAANAAILEAAQAQAEAALPDNGPVKIGLWGENVWGLSWNGAKSSCSGTSVQDCISQALEIIAKKKRPAPVVVLAPVLDTTLNPDPGAIAAVEVGPEPEPEPVVVAEPDAPSAADEDSGETIPDALARLVPPNLSLKAQKEAAAARLIELHGKISLKIMSEADWAEFNILTQYAGWFQ